MQNADFTPTVIPDASISCPSQDKRSEGEVDFIDSAVQSDWVSATP